MIGIVGGRHNVSAPTSYFIIDLQNDVIHQDLDFAEVTAEWGRIAGARPMPEPDAYSDDPALFQDKHPEGMIPP